MQEAELLPDLRAWVAADCDFGALGARAPLLKQALEGPVYPPPEQRESLGTAGKHRQQHLPAGNSG